MILGPNDLHIKDGWTHRWSPIREKGLPQLTGQRLAYRNCETRFIVVAAGGRSLKTEIAKRKLVEKFCLNVYFHPNGNVDERGRVDEKYFFAGPTRDQVKEIAWEDILALIPKKFILRINYSKFIIEHIQGPKLYLIGLDVPQRMEGKPWNWGVFTEFADIKEGAWEANLRPLFADRKGGCIIEGRPDMDKPNNKKFKELFQRGLGNDPNWKSFNWHSIDVLDDTELEEAKSTMTSLMMDQEFGGSFVTAPGMAYQGFVRSTHVKDDLTQFDPLLPVRVSCDFNAEHHTWEIMQVDKNKVYKVIDEVYIQGGTVEFMIMDLKEKLDKYAAIRGKLINRAPSLADLNLVFYGDYTGENRSAQATHTAWRQIRNAFQLPNGNSIAEFHYRRNPPVGDRIEKVRGALCNARDEVHLYVNSKCTHAITDFEEVTRKMLFQQIKGAELTHATDCIGYLIVEFEKHG